MCCLLFDVSLLLRCSLRVVRCSLFVACWLQCLRLLVCLFVAAKFAVACVFVFVVRQLLSVRR